MKNRRVLLILPVLVILGLGCVLWVLAARRPRVVFDPHVIGADLSNFSVEPSGHLRLTLESGFKGKPNHAYKQVVIEPDSGKVVSLRQLASANWSWEPSLSWTSPGGWSVFLPDGRGGVGDHVIHDNEGGYAENWLRLTSPQDKTQVLKKLPVFYDLSDLKITPDGNEVLALKENVLWRYNIQTGKVVRIVRSGVVALTPEGSWPKTSVEVWVHDDWWNNQSGPVLTPDGRFIVGFQSNVNFETYEFTDEIDFSRYYSTLVLYDSRTGKVARRIPMPFPEKYRTFEARPFKARNTSDGQYLLLEGPNWDKVLCLRFKDGKRMGIFDWEQTPYTSGRERQQPIRSTDGYYFCDQDGTDIVLRNVLTGKITHRAVGALGKSKDSASDPLAPNQLPYHLVIAKDLSALYFQPVRDHMMTHKLWRWPLQAE